MLLQVGHFFLPPLAPLTGVAPHRFTDRIFLPLENVEAGLVPPPAVIVLQHFVQTAVDVVAFRVLRGVFGALEPLSSFAGSSDAESPLSCFEPVGMDM